MIALIFPGQGSQFVGMGQDFYREFSAAREVFQEIDEVLKESLSHLIFEGTEEELKRTENTQPALMAMSLACLKVLQQELNFDVEQRVSFLAGHSLGEYSAYAAAGTFSLSEATSLLRLRGRAMQEAVPFGEGAMAALIGANVERAEQIARIAAACGVCEIANDNSPEQVVLSGEKAAIEKAIEIARDHGVKRAVLLPVSAPFHCSMMEPAAHVMEQALTSTDIKTPKVPVVSNVLATPVKEKSRIAPTLVQQISGRVRWREIGLFLASQGVTTVIEIGAGKVLSGLMKRISPDMTTLACNTIKDLEELNQQL